MQTIFRKLTHEALAQHTLTGNVIDLGGTGRAEYASYIQGTFTRLSVNMDEKSKPDYIANLEHPLVFETQQFDGALLINVLEHIYHAPQLIQETGRILKTGGTAIAVIPYLVAIHPSPNDYWRFSHDTLVNLFHEAGFKHVSVQALGSGVFMVRHALISRLLPHMVQLITEYPTRLCAHALDSLWHATARLLKKKYLPEHYPLGYIVVAHK